MMANYLQILSTAHKCNGCMPVKAVCKPQQLTLDAVAFSLLGRVPSARTGIPGSRPARCDGADQGGVTLMP